MNSKIFKWAGLKKKLVMVAILSFSLGKIGRAHV